MSLIFVDLHGTVGPNDCDTIEISQNSENLHKDYGFHCYFCPFCRLRGRASAPDHFRIWLLYERSEKMSPQTAEMIRDTRVWCHFSAAREDGCVSNERLHKDNVCVPLYEGRHET